ncbi:SDR family oxidoreductase (plasmid) [Ensifer adhaerens]|uniref:SDR family oxidoreductase n=1 Tax=Ensifer adhaerens TaxID=106592 RepID=UPI001CBC8FDD|nr:SDR family oxidoreductase [Ensifer adhaerens]MBZ7927142.1 SDR family oxidoreductase [Ensifer adhaerens]UAX98181.1 SDR family oxidoreductase [Ensifer adhaerens]UAY05563.1 SDR family oxidoreductase [Ensifer adhaerens]UAY12941.1 SDR family oxidoreductase [Ensifer adhaerens]
MSNLRRVLITAACSGIGREIANAFLDDGHLVHVCDISVPDGTTSMGNLTVSQVDVTNSAQVANWVACAERNMGGIDVLINNAGIAGPTSPVESVDIKSWRECLAVGLDSHFLTAHYVAPIMKRQKSGTIINISSTAGQFGYPLRTPYAAAKWAVIGLTKSLAIELGGANITVNAVCPGSVSGDRMRKVIEREANSRNVTTDFVTAEYINGQSIKRFTEPSEIAAMCRFLSSDSARMVSGQVIAVDGNTETYHL